MSCLKASCQRGFSLVEFAIVIVISSLLISSLLGAYATYLKRVRLETSYNRLYEVNNLLADAWRVDNRYFCPADPSLKPGDTQYGYENCAAAVAAGSCTGGSTGVCVAAGLTVPSRGDRVLIGMLPFKSIMEQFEAQKSALSAQLEAATDPALKEEIRTALDRTKKTLALRMSELTFDGWGNRMSYMVSAAWTTRLEDDAPALRTMGSIEVLDANGQRAAENGVHFALVSHGPNGNGAYSQLGVMRGAGCSGLSPAETENCDNDAVVLRAAVQSLGDNNDKIDDLVAYNITASNELWERVACGTELCLHNKNAANVVVGSGAASEKLTVGGVMRADDVKTTAAQICDEGTNCFSPAYIGGTDLNRCDSLTPTAPNKKWVARRITGQTVSGANVPYLECVEVTMDAYNFTCPPGQMLRGFQDSQPVCYDPCGSEPISYARQESCPDNMSGSLTYYTEYVCATGTYTAYETEDTCTYNPINGACGAADGGSFISAPNTNTCMVGTPSALTETASGWTWQCIGKHGGTTDDCSASRPVNGACGSANGSLFGSAPGSNLCRTGSAGAVSGSGPWTWRCNGSNGGVTVTCAASPSAPPGGSCTGTVQTQLFTGDKDIEQTLTAGCADDTIERAVNTYELRTVGTNAYEVWRIYQLTYNQTGCVATAPIENTTAEKVDDFIGTSVSTSRPVLTDVPGHYEDQYAVQYQECNLISGTCGTANGSNFYAAPSGTALCNSGTPSAVGGTGPWTWTCVGADGGTTAACSANRTQNGACGTANGVVVASAPASNLCSVGSASAVGGSNPYSWTCAGVNGGTTASCASGTPTTVNGACGASNGGNFASAPASNLCNTGTATAVGGSGPWTWSCTGGGTPTGTTASCSANRLQNGSCGTANGVVVASAPASNLCSVGSASAVGGSNPYSWTCAGVNGGTTASCASGTPTTVNGSCGTSNGSASYSAPASNLCAAGSASAVGGTGPWSWTCAGTGTPAGTTASCSAIKMENGVCGASNGAVLPAKPTTDLCSVGTASAVSGIALGPWAWTCTGVNGGTTASCSAEYDSGGGGGCFTATTTVLMEDGSRKPVVDLKIGDKVRGQGQVNTVIATKAFYVKSQLYRINGSKDAFVTANHPFYTKDGWKAIDAEGARKDHPGVEVGELKVGDVLVDEQGKEIVLESFEAEDHGWITVYNPSLDGDHTYYADGLLVHNLPPSKD